MKFYEIVTKLADEERQTPKTCIFLIQGESFTESILKINNELEGQEFSIFRGATKNFVNFFENPKGEKYFKCQIETDPMEAKPFKEWYVIQSNTAETAYKEITELMDLDNNSRILSMIEYNIEDVI